MNLAMESNSITLVVLNPENLHFGSVPKIVFDQSGGTIGCRSANWTLTDKRNQVQPIHCEIITDEGAFCVVDRSGQTRINNTDSALGPQVSARLNDGDILHIGPYRVAVHLHDQEHALPDASRHLSQYGVDELLNVQEKQFNELQSGSYEHDPDVADRDPRFADFDDLTEKAHKRPGLDPLQALETARKTPEPTRHTPFDPTHYGLSASETSHADLAATRFEAVSGKPQTLSGDKSMSHHDDYWTSRNAPHEGDHGSADVAPLLQGLGVSLDTVDSRRLLLEVGQAVSAAIQGITALYEPMPNDEQHLALLRRTLQPIEDNPLRLGQNYQDTLNALFSDERSLVHLSPKAAIDESLSQARQHNKAIIAAINASLQALLQAFAPAVLLERFQRYRSEPPQSASDGEWAWNMYSHYYNELSSPRQKGFEKLFWEVFEQAYDRALRMDE